MIEVIVERAIDLSFTMLVQSEPAKDDLGYQGRSSTQEQSVDELLNQLEADPTVKMLFFMTLTKCDTKLQILPCKQMLSLLKDLYQNEEYFNNRRQLRDRAGMRKKVP